MMRFCLFAAVFVGSTSARFYELESTSFFNKTRHCDGFSAAKCFPEDGTLVDTIPVNDEDSCQTRCNDLADCHYYTFDPTAAQDETCSLYASTYRFRCSLYAGNREAKLDVCLTGRVFNRNANDCDKFLLQECDYSFSDPIESASRGSIFDAFECQEYCEVLADAGCDFWVFESPVTAPLSMTKCDLYSYKFNRSDCPVHHGPDAPTYSVACA